MRVLAATSESPTYRALANATGLSYLELVSFVSCCGLKLSDSGLCLFAATCSRSCSLETQVNLTMHFVQLPETSMLGQQM